MSNESPFAKYMTEIEKAIFRNFATYTPEPPLDPHRDLGDWQPSPVPNTLREMVEEQ